MYIQYEYAWMCENIDVYICFSASIDEGTYNKLHSDYAHIKPTKTALFGQNTWLVLMVAYA